MPGSRLNLGRIRCLILIDSGLLLWIRCFIVILANVCIFVGYVD